jgi:hypothetical protein
VAPQPRPLSALTAAQAADVSEGVRRAMDAPLRSVYAQAGATWNAFDGAQGRLEAGVHPWKNFSAFAAATVDRNGPGAELGGRWEWRW